MSGANSKKIEGGEIDAADLSEFTEMIMYIDGELSETAMMLFEVRLAEKPKFSLRFQLFCMISDSLDTDDTAYWADTSSHPQVGRTRHRASGDAWISHGQRPEASKTAPANESALASGTGVVEGRRGQPRDEAIRMNGSDTAPERSPGVASVQTSVAVRLMKAWSNGDSHAKRMLMDVVSNDLRQIASDQRQREIDGYTFQSEAWLMVSARDELPTWRCRKHFFTWASRVMVSFFWDRARRIALDGRDRVDEWATPEFREPGSAVGAALSDDKLLDIIKSLASIDEALATIFRLKIVTNLSNAEIASGLELTVTQVRRAYSFAMTWAYGRMKENVAQEVVPAPPLNRP